MGVETAVASTAFKVGLGVLGNAASAAYGVVSKTAGAFGTLAKGMGDASAAMSSAAKSGNGKGGGKSPTVIINNTGMAGSAGKQKVTGRGTLPAKKVVATPRVSEKMPTEALLNTAVKYLSSIDKTLKSQLDFERRTFEQQVRDERESQIESKPSAGFSFSDIKNRLSGLGSTAKDTGSALLTAAKWAAGLAVTASLVASALNPKELEELKKNIEAFKEKFSWLTDLANLIPSGGIGGFIFGLLTGKGLKGRLMGGLKGGIFGIVTTALANVAIAKITGGQVSEDTKSTLNLAAAGGIGYLGYRGIKSGIGLKKDLAAAGTKITGLRQSSSYFDPKSGRIKNVSTGKYMATKDATGFLKSPRWQKFLSWLTKRGERALVNKIQQKIAIAVTTGAIAATGIGAAFGAIGFLLNLGFNLYFMYEIYELWKDFTSDEEAAKAGVSDADLEKELNKPDATQVGAPGVTPGLEPQGKSLGKVTPEMLGKTPEQLTDDELRTIVEAQGRIEDPRGVTNNPGGILYGTGPLKEHQVGSVGANADSSVRIAKYDTAENGIRAAMMNWRTSRYAGKPIRDSLGMWSGGDAAKYESWLTGRPAQYSGSGTTLTGESSIADTLKSGATATLEATAKLFGAIGGAIVKPGIERNMVPASSSATDRINNESMQLQNDITFGIKKQKAKDTAKAPTMPGTPQVGNGAPPKSISSMDPNYSNMNIVTRYLAHFRMAA